MLVTHRNGSFGDLMLEAEIITREKGYWHLQYLVTVLLLAPVAQWIEYWPPKPRVAGSIPAGRAKTEDTFDLCHAKSHENRYHLLLTY